MTYSIGREYDSDFSATEVVNTLNSVARANGAELSTPAKSAKPYHDGERLRENWFEIETRASAGHLDEVLGRSEGQHYDMRFRVLGTCPADDEAVVVAEKRKQDCPTPIC